MVKIFSLLVFHLVVVSKLLWCTLNNTLHVIKMCSGKSLSKFAEDLSVLSAINRVFVCWPFYLFYGNNIKTCSDLVSLRFSNENVWNFFPFTLWSTNRWLYWFLWGCLNWQSNIVLSSFYPCVFLSSLCLKICVDYVQHCSGQGCTDSPPLSPQLRALQCCVLWRGGTQVSYSRLSLWSLLQVSYLSHGI